MIFKKFDDKSDIIEFLRNQIKSRSLKAIKSDGVFYMGVSGGSVSEYIIQVIHRLNALRLEKFHVYLCDERYVEETHKDSTYGVYKKALIPSTCLKEENIFGINTSLPLEECAQDYENKMVEDFNTQSGELPRFDMLFLGIGPDGHTCSLFPQHDVLNETERLIAPITDSPKPPAQRVTMTLPLINNAKCVIYLAFGEEKADIVKRIFVDKEDLPAGKVNPPVATYCLLDTASGKYINC